MIVKKLENVWEIERDGEMIVPGIVFASDALFSKIKNDKTIEQIKNVAKLPGIVEKSIAMPDAHQGYGFPIGGVAAFDLKKGIVSPGGVGYDIGCGVRLLTVDILVSEFLKKRENILNEIFKAVPSGVGHNSSFNLTDKELDVLLENGVGWCVDKGYSLKEDIERIEDGGCIQNARASAVSGKAKKRGKNQLGTLGSGNHFLEIQKVETIFDKKTAEHFGISKGKIGIMIHSGSRGLGHQTASDYIQEMEKKYGFEHLSDRELTYAPISSELGKKYLGAMAAAANFAFVNRQIITYRIRQVFQKHFPKKEVKLVYDIAHNIAKIEKHNVSGTMCDLCVHRKGATRSFGPGREELPVYFRKTGCPILIPGSMGTSSYVLVGTKKAEELSWGSTAHGAGRVLSRSYAVKNLSQKSIEKSLQKNDILLKAGSHKGIIEEAPEAYKNVDEVAQVSHKLGIGSLVARLKPVAVMKG